MAISFVEFDLKLYNDREIGIVHTWARKKLSWAVSDYAKKT